MRRRAKTAANNGAITTIAALALTAGWLFPDQVQRAGIDADNLQKGAIVIGLLAGADQRALSRIADQLRGAKK